MSSPSLDLPAQYPERPNVLMEKNAVVASVIPGMFAMKSACERLLILLQYEEFANAWVHFCTMPFQLGHDVWRGQLDWL